MNKIISCAPKGTELWMIVLSKIGRFTKVSMSSLSYVSSIWRDVTLIFHRCWMILQHRQETRFNEGCEQRDFRRLSHRIWMKYFVNTCASQTVQKLSCVRETRWLLWKSWLSCRALPVLNCAVKIEWTTNLIVKEASHLFVRLWLVL